jgi:hypothetical protein
LPGNGKPLFAHRFRAHHQSGPDFAEAAKSIASRSTGNSEEPAMVVVCSVSALVRTTLFIVMLALVAGLALAGPAAPASTPGSGPAGSPATAEPVTH